MKNKDKRVCIKVHSEEVFNKLWMELVHSGYKTRETNPHFREMGLRTYIWVNYDSFDKGETLGSADNPDYANWDYEFDTETDLDRIYEFYGINANKPVKENIMNQKIAIRVGKSQELSRIIQEFLFSKGFKWSSGKWSSGTNPIPLLGENPVIYVNTDEKLEWNPIDNDYRGIKRYDAATQMGEIIELFEIPPVPEIIVENDFGGKYRAKFFPDYVEFEYAKIENTIFCTLNNLYNTSCKKKGFKTITGVSIGLGKFSPDLIKQIVEHPHFGKETK